MAKPNVAAASKLADESLLDRCAVPVVPTLVRAVLHAVLRRLVSSIIRLIPGPVSCEGWYNHVVRRPDPVTFRQAVTRSQPRVLASRGKMFHSCELGWVSGFGKSTSQRETMFTSFVPVQMRVDELKCPVKQEFRV